LKQGTWKNSIQNYRYKQQTPKIILDIDSNNYKYKINYKCNGWTVFALFHHRM